MLTLEKYSIGTGDRFSLQGEAQLRAIMRAGKEGVSLAPVWNKSYREHSIVGSVQEATWKEAAGATAALGYSGTWYVDADHINLENVDPFISYSNFFTIDVADAIGKVGPEKELKQITEQFAPFTGALVIPGIGETYTITADLLKTILNRFFGAIREAALIYRYIADKRGNDAFVTEISMDEVEHPQTPIELFFILLLIDHFGIPVQTIAPKFTGRFNKGVDYSGDISAFSREFEEDLMVIRHVTGSSGLPGNLKLSVHSGSDKFSIYPVIGDLIRKHDAGIHVKTAGTTWLEEVIGLALSGGKALEMAKEIYSRAYERKVELCVPYSTVIDIDFKNLPSPEQVREWDSERFVNTLRHIPGHPQYDPGFRQLIHVGYRVAAEMGGHFLDMIRENLDIVGKQVEENIYDRHIRRLFFEK